MGFSLSKPYKIELPLEVLEMKNHVVEMVHLLSEFFHDEPTKISIWINSQNPNFGSASPMELILTGRGHIVISFIKAARQDGWELP